MESLSKWDGKLLGMNGINGHRMMIVDERGPRLVYIESA